MNERLLFAGTPDFAATMLKALLEASFNIVGVLTQPDRQKGRGQQLLGSPVKNLALAHHLPVFQPTNLKDPMIRETLAALNSSRMIVAAYGVLLPPSILELPRAGCLNVHASLLPRFRGASPIQQAILSGDKETGITLMQMDKGLDTGPMLVKASHLIAPRETYGSLENALASLGARLLIDYLYNPRPPTPILQDQAFASYAPKILKEQTILDWSQTAVTLERQIRAFYPHPSATTFLNGNPLKILDATLGPTVHTAKSGTLVSISPSHLGIATGSGILQVTHLQLPSRKPVSITELVRTKTLPSELQEGFVFG